MRQGTYVKGILFLLLGIVALIVSVVAIPKEAYGYAMGGCFLLIGLIMMILSKLEGSSFEESIEGIVSTIDREKPTEHEKIIIELVDKTFDKDLDVVNYIVSDKKNIYLEIQNKRLYHVMILKKYIEIESLDPKNELEIKRLAELLENEQDSSMKKKYEKQIYNLMETQTDESFYVKHGIMNMTKEEIINLIKNEIL